MVRFFFLFKVWHFNFNIFGKQAENVFRKNKAIVRFAASEQSEGSPQWFQERPRIDRSSEWHFKAKRRVVILWTEWMKQSNSRLSWQCCTGAKQLQPEQMFQEMRRVYAKMFFLAWGYERHTTSEMLRTPPCIVMFCRPSSLNTCLWYERRNGEKKDTNTTSGCGCQIHQPRKQTSCPGSVSFSDRASGKPNHG